MPAIFWPVNPCKVDVYEIMDCLQKALGSININHVYDLACEMISKAAHQRWIEEMHYWQLNKEELPPKLHKHTHVVTDLWSARYQVLVDQKRRKDAKPKASTQPKGQKGRGGTLQFQQQDAESRPSRMANAIPARMEGNCHQSYLWDHPGQPRGHNQPQRDERDKYLDTEHTHSVLIIINQMKHQHLFHPTTRSHPE